jgi:hypothetical protein
MVVLPRETCQERPMATKRKAKKATGAKKATKSKRKTAARSNRGRAQDRARVAGGQDYEVAYEGKKIGKKASAVRKAIKKVGNSRKKVTRKLRGG